MPSIKDLDISKILAILVSVFFLDLVLFYLIPAQLLSAEENGFLENMQVAFLTLGMLGFLFNCFANNLKSFAFFGALICLSFILREIDVELLDIASIIKTLGSGLGRNILMATLFIISITLILRGNVNDDLNVLFKSNFIIVIIFAGLFLISSWIFDQKIIQTASNLLIEEISEVNAYFLIFISTAVFWFDFKN